MNYPLVSVIIPTRNSAQFLEACLKSVKNQTYKNIEIIVVDNQSTDDTKQIALSFCHSREGGNPESPIVNVFNKGHERSAQRNYGAEKSNGEYLLFIDSDMELTAEVVQACIRKIQLDTKTKAIIIPEESFGIGFWAKCKKLERSFYISVDWMEAARFYEKKLFLEINGFNEKLISAEDWELSQKVGTLGKIGHINQFIYHNEGSPSLIQILRKKFYYAKFIRKYQKEQKNPSLFSKQTGILERYKLFFSSPKKLIQNPIISIGMLFMKTVEFAFGLLGYVLSLVK